MQGQGTRQEMRTLCRWLSAALWAGLEEGTGGGAATGGDKGQEKARKQEQSKNRHGQDESHLLNETEWDTCRGAA